jgi:hypothetical protein
MPVRVSEGLQVVSPWLYRPKPYALENHSLTVYFPNRHAPNMSHVLIIVNIVFD